VHAGVTDNVRTRSGVLFALREQAADEVDQGHPVVTARWVQQLYTLLVPFLSLGVVVRIG
jgi:hypothetical protein